MWGWQLTEEGQSGLRICGKTQGLLGKQKNSGWSNSITAIRVSCKGVSRKNRWGSKLQSVRTKTTTALDITMVVPKIFEDIHFWCAYVFVCVWYTGVYLCVYTCVHGIIGYPLPMYVCSWEGQGDCQRAFLVRVWNRLSHWTWCSLTRHIEPL